MKFSKKILKTFVDFPIESHYNPHDERLWQELMEDVGLEIKSIEGDVFNLELLANRGDHYCYSGIAREIAGRTGGKIVELPNIKLEPAAAKIFSIDTDKCIAYSLTPFKLTDHGSQVTGYEMLLEISGINVILPAIDITNVVLLELGQPAHIYDADKVVGKIHIRESKKNEHAALLFHSEPIKLPEGICVIADEEKILCIAGIIGCKGADVDKNTKNILLETALFDPISIRKTGRVLLEKPTLAAQVFERGGNFGTIKRGAERVAYLYKQVGWELAGAMEFAQRVQLPKKKVALSGDFVRQQLEIEISDKEIEERLLRYGFTRKSCLSHLFLGGRAKSDTTELYAVPFHRIWDIKGEPADLIEELARSIGYNSLPAHLPVAEIGSAPTDAELRKAEINSYLVHNGFYEVFTDAMYSPRHAKLSPIKDHLALENSVDGGYAYMKNNTIVQAVELVEKNLRVKNREIRAFERGKIFPVTGGETEVLWGVMNGAKINALDAKGLIENLLDNLGLEKGSFLPEKFADEPKSFLHPNRSQRISIGANGEIEIGCFGEIHPSLLMEFDIKNDSPVYFELDMQKLLDMPRAIKKYKSPPAVIPSVRDISINIPYGKLADSIKGFILKNYPAVAEVAITDIYDKPKESLRNITYTLTFLGKHSAESLGAMIVEIMQKAQQNA